MDEIKAKHPDDSPSSSYSEQNIHEQNIHEGQGLDLVRKRNDQAGKFESCQPASAQSSVLNQV